MKQNKLRSRVIWVILGAGTALGLLFSGRVPGLPKVDFRALRPFLLLSAVMMLLSLYGAIILHEAGHLLFGLLTGYRFVSFSVFGLQWQRGGGWADPLQPAIGAGHCRSVPDGAVLSAGRGFPGGAV